MDFVNSKDNGTYLWNLAHFVSVLADNVIFCCGDLLPLLSSVTSRDYGQDVIEPCGGMTLETSFSFLNRLMSLVDVIVFTSSLAFSGVETNRNMSTGGFLRQCLRLGELNMDKTGKHRRGERTDRKTGRQTKILSLSIKKESCLKWFTSYLRISTLSDRYLMGRFFKDCPAVKALWAGRHCTLCDRILSSVPF